MESLSSLLGNLESLGASEQIKTKLGISVDKLRQQDRTKFRQLFSDNAKASSSGTDPYSGITDGQGTLSVTAQPRILLHDKNGKLVGEANLRECPNALRDLPNLFRRRLLSANVVRIPAELKSLVASGEYLALPKGTETSIEQLIRDCFGANANLVFVDERIRKKLMLFKVSKSEHWTKMHALELTIESLDMFFRRVGQIWFLGASPGNPELEARRRVVNARKIKSAKLLKFFTDNVQNPVDSSEESYDGADLPISELSVNEKQLLAGMLTKCSSVDIASFKNALNSGAVSIGCSLGYHVSYSVGPNQYGFFLSER
jgi:hypothetical protein